MWTLVALICNLTTGECIQGAVEKPYLSYEECKVVDYLIMEEFKATGITSISLEQQCIHWGPRV